MALDLTSVKIQINSCYCGMALSHLKLPPNCFLLGIVRGVHIILASEEATIHCGDDLLGVALSSAQMPALKFILQKTHPIYYSFNECLLDNTLNNSTYPARSFNNSCYKDGYK
ncbi:TrkA C-terminal domain-containing protein [Calothrix sp. PCC 6303]|uniref:TrkA C-terminal domain-containing protein n=1 Tax=Calothrix sp. PCC 6303 TaxID=1170562 RepID=UPI0002E4926E|nr:TrkA C-terminal domain-containing protein [Calothrix sp. PCC 6303]